MPAQTLIKDLDGILYFNMPGKPTLCKATVLTKDAEDLTTAVTLDTCQDQSPDIDTDLDGAVAAGATSIVLTAGTAALEGAKLQIEGDDPDAMEWVRGKAWVDVTNTLTIWNPLARAHLDEAKVQTTGMQLELAAAFQDQQYDRNIVYVYATINGLADRYTFVYSVKLAKFRNPITELDLLAYMPSAREHGWEENAGFSRQLEAAEDHVRSQMTGMGVDLDNILNPDDAKLALIWATIWVIKQAEADTNPEKETTRDYAEAKFLQMCLNLKDNAVWLEAGVQDMTMDDEEEAGLTPNTSLLSS